MVIVFVFTTLASYLHLNGVIHTVRYYIPLPPSRFMAVSDMNNCDWIGYNFFFKFHKSFIGSFKVSFSTFLLVPCSRRLQCLTEKTIYCFKLSLHSYDTSHYHVFSVRPSFPRKLRQPNVRICNAVTSAHLTWWYQLNKYNRLDIKMM